MGILSQRGGLSGIGARTSSAIRGMSCENENRRGQRSLVTRLRRNLFGGMPEQKRTGNGDAPVGVPGLAVVESF